MSGRSRKVYLGDSVYAQYDDFGGIWLTTENGLPTDPSNKIYLEYAVLRSLDEFRKGMREDYETRGAAGGKGAGG